MKIFVGLIRISKLKDLNGIVVEVFFEGLLVYIGCHGIPGNILKSSDGRRVDLRDLQELVNSDFLPAFSGAPKIFIVNACRGDGRIELELEAGKHFKNLI